jgi:signal transduction histidine kinase
MRGETVEEDLEYERPDGVRLTLRASAVPVRDDEDRVAAAVLVVYDVSSARGSERQLRESEMRYRLASRAINDAIWDWDLVTGRVDWSDGIFLRLGHPPSSVIPTADWWLAHIHPLDRERVRTNLDATLAGTSDSWHDEYRFRRFDRTWADIVDRGFIVRDAEHRALRAVGAMEDVTERRRADAERAALLDRERRARAEAEAANRLKDEFLAVVSHELRTPLSPILGFVDVLREDGLAAHDAGVALDAIERNARTLKHLIDDLLDVARITSGKLALEYAPYPLSDAVKSALELLRPSVEAKGLTLDVALAEEDDVVAGDARRLVQAVANLLSNAVKFTPRGGSIRVSVVRHGERAVLTVSDTGKGIAPSLLPHVFERFRQGDTSDTRVHGGLGLGLAIVRHIVDMHGGAIAAQSPGEGRGATFTVTFPLLRRPANS